MSTITTNHELFIEFEIINKSMTPQASLELPKIGVMHDGEESRKIDLLAHIFFPKVPSLTFDDKTQHLSELVDKSFKYAQEPIAPSIKPSKLSRLMIINAGSTPTMSFMCPVQSDTLIFHPSVNELASKPRKPIHESSYDHLPSISELCEELSPDETALACDPIGYSSAPRSTPDRQPFLKPAGRLVREQTFIDLEDALDENPEDDELACDPEDYVSPSTPAMQPIKPAGKLVRQQAFVDLSDALQEDSSKADLKNSSDNKDVPSELIFRMSDDGERQVRTISPYPLQKS